MIAALVWWSLIGFVATLFAAVEGLLDGSDLGPLSTGFLCLVAGPLVFAIYLTVIITYGLSKLDAKWFS